jgi:hypothetical protein
VGPTEQPPRSVTNLMFSRHIVVIVIFLTISLDWRVCVRIVLMGSGMCVAWSQVQAAHTAFFFSFFSFGKHHAHERTRTRGGRT